MARKDGISFTSTNRVGNKRRLKENINGKRNTGNYNVIGWNWVPSLTLLSPNYASDYNANQGN